MFIFTIFVDAMTLTSLANGMFFVAAVVVYGAITNFTMTQFTALRFFTATG